MTHIAPVEFVLVFVPVVFFFLTLNLRAASLISLEYFFFFVQNNLLEANYDPGQVHQDFNLSHFTFSLFQLLVLLIFVVTFALRVFNRSQGSRINWKENQALLVFVPFLLWITAGIFTFWHAPLDYGWMQSMPSLLNQASAVLLFITAVLAFILAPRLTTTRAPSDQEHDSGFIQLKIAGAVSIILLILAAYTVIFSGVGARTYDWSLAGHPNEFGMLALLNFATVLPVIYSARKSVKLFTLAVLAVSLLTTYLCNSKSALVGLLLGVLVYFFLLLVGHSKALVAVLRRRLKLSVGLLVLFIGALGFVVWRFGRGISAIISSEWHLREITYRASFDYLREHPLIGAGPGRLVAWQVATHGPYADGAYGDASSSGSPYELLLPPHNSFILLAAVFGIVGLVLFVGALLWLFVDAFRKNPSTLRSSPGKKSTVLTFVILIPGLLLDYGLTNSRFLIFVLFLLGMLYANLKIERVVIGQK